MISHLSGAENWPQLFALIEEKPFLADQADYFRGFERSGEDIERHALPATIQLGDWDRFLRYATLALNLRGVAESLAEPDILRALVRGGRLDLARDVVGRLADPLRRAEARAVLAASCRSRSDLLPDLLGGIEEDLAHVTPTAAALSAIARSLGPELSGRFRDWIRRIEPAESGRIWAAVAASWLDRGETRAPAFWEALAGVSDRQALLELTRRLGWLDRGEIEESLQKITALWGEDVSARRLAFANYFDRQTRRRPDRAFAAWERWVDREPILWTAELVEACRELLKRSSPRRIEDLLSRFEDVEAKAALRIADLEAHPDSRRTAAALEAVSQIPDGPTKLHWSLRYLEARPPEPVDEVRGQVGAVAAYLYELRYDAHSSDLRRFLDLAARFYPKEVGRLVEDVAWSPTSRPETLLTIAEETNREEVVTRLLDDAERFAAAVSLTEAEGFRLRGELIRRATSRLCQLRSDLQGLDNGIERLLPEEEDDLRAELAPILAEDDRKEQARKVAEGIRDPHRQFLGLLRVMPPDDLPQDFLGSRSLYAAMASARSIEEERLALCALLVNPFDPQELARRHITPLRSGDLQTQALLRLARHALAFQRSFYGRRQDPAAALEVVRGSLTVETDEKLAALTPEIAALGAEMGPKEAVSEFQEAARRLARLDTVPWKVREEALEHLLSLIVPIFLSRGERERKATRRAFSVLEAMARLPLGPRPDRALDDLRSHWHEILPILFAVAERLPGPLPRSLVEAIRDGIAACPEASEATRIVFELCQAPPAERACRAGHALDEAAPDPALLNSLVYLLTSRDPQKVLPILLRLPSEERGTLALHLIRYSWLLLPEAERLLGSIEDPIEREEAALWLRLASPQSKDADSGLQALAGLLALRELDPSTPGLQPILEHLWTLNPERSRPALAWAYTSALRAGGRERGEAALRFWLHAHLAPSLGTEQPEVLERNEKKAREALESALALSPPVER